MRNPFYRLAASALAVDLAYNALRTLLAVFRAPLNATLIALVCLALMAWNITLVSRGSRPALIVATVLQGLAVAGTVLGTFTVGFSVLGFVLSAVSFGLCALALASDRRW